MQQAGKEMNPFRPEVLLLRGQLSTVLLSLRGAKVRQLSAYTKLLVIFNIFRALYSIISLSGRHSVPQKRAQHA